MEQPASPVVPSLVPSPPLAPAAAPPKAAPAPKNYPLYFRAAGMGMYFKNTCLGVTLTGNSLEWHVDGKDDGAQLINIATIHLQSGGDFKNATNQCTIVFKDRFAITVTDANSLGVTDDSQTPLYRDFVRALHARLAATGLADGAIAFTSGYQGARFAVAAVASALLGIIAFGIPLVIWIWKGDWHAFWLLCGGAFLLWPMFKMVKHNKPSHYDPKRLPEELMQ
jgi:hypothetical protein